MVMIFFSFYFMYECIFVCMCVCTYVSIHLSFIDEDYEGHNFGKIRSGINSKIKIGGRHNGNGIYFILFNV
jgi:hypothetical protein